MDVGIGDWVTVSAERGVDGIPTEETGGVIACVEVETALVQPTKDVVNKARIAIVINIFFIIINITKTKCFGYHPKVL